MLRRKWGVQFVPDFLKHLFNKHDGEARMIAEDGWMQLEHQYLCQPQFWDPQFARTDGSRKWLASKDPNRWLTRDEVDWVLDQRDGQTQLIRRAGAASRAPCAASGARSRRASNFEIRRGVVVTLAEMFFYGADLCTAYDIYKLYMDLPIFIHKQVRPGRRRLT